jgi:hypothetical protein
MTSLHTSQVVDPPNGRLPPLTPAAREKRKLDDGLLDRPAAGPEDRPLSSRCIRPDSIGPAWVGSGPGGQESTLEIIQSPQMVVVRVEALRSQLIYLDGRPLPPASVHLEQGAARGHWEDDTLIVEYTNFAVNGMVVGARSYSPPAIVMSDGSVRKRLTERWKRLDDTHLLYGFTLDDPGSRTKPYSVEFVMWRLTDQEQLVEYACHEGNVNLEFTLSGARSKSGKKKRNSKSSSSQPLSLRAQARPRVFDAPCRGGRRSAQRCSDEESRPIGAHAHGDHDGSLESASARASLVCGRIRCE